MAKPIKIDHWVRTADGAIGRVAYVYEARALADVQIDNDSARSVELPLAELRRIGNPNEKRPPIVGLPSVRPVCVYCGRKVRPMVEHKREQTRATGAYGRVVARVFVRWDVKWLAAEDGMFCTSHCAIRFALAAYRAGYRIQRKTT